MVDHGEMTFGRLESHETIPAWRPDGTNIIISASSSVNDDRRKGRGLEPSVMIRFTAVTFLCTIRRTPEDKP